MYSEYKKYLEKQRFNMEYNYLTPICGLKVSAICLGTMTFQRTKNDHVSNYYHIHLIVSVLYQFHYKSYFFRGLIPYFPPSF